MYNIQSTANSFVDMRMFGNYCAVAFPLIHACYGAHNQISVVFKNSNNKKQTKNEHK